MKLDSLTAPAVDAEERKDEKMKKLVKKYVLMAIVFFVVGLVYGVIFNFILQGENASVLFSYVQGLLVGFLTGIIYTILTFSLGYCLKPEDLDDSCAKTITIFMNVIVVGLMCYEITRLIGNNKPITLTYAWMHVVNLLFAGAVVGKANYDGKILRREVEKDNV